METSQLLNLLAPYEPKEHRAGYITFYCPGCQQDTGRGVQNAYVYASDRPYLRCSNIHKCGWSKPIEATEAVYHTKTIISPIDHPFWSAFLKQRRISDETIQKYKLCVFTDPKDCPHPSLWERLCFPIYTLTGQFAGYTGRAKEGEPRYFHYWILSSGAFIGFGAHCYEPGQELCLVEGPLDVLAAAVQDRVAVGCLGSTWSESRLKAIAGWHPANLILGMDNDEAGWKSTSDILRWFGEHHPHQPIEVLDYLECKDNSELHMTNRQPKKDKPEDWVTEDCISYFPHRPDIVAKKMSISLEAASSLLEQRSEAQRMNHTTRGIKRALGGAQTLLDKGEPEQAVQMLSKIQLPSIIKPLTGASLLNTVKEWKPISGNRNGLLPSIDEAFNGFKGLCFLGGAPGVGKTILASQLVVGLLANSPQYICLFLTLELSAVEIGLNMLAMCEQFHLEFNHIFKRCQFIEELPTKGFTVNQVFQHTVKLEKDNGHKVIICVDRIQLLPCNEGTDLNRDEQRYDWVTQLRNKIYPNPVIAISELAKVNWGSGWLNMDAFKGSGRGGHAADQALIITPLTDAQLAANVSCNGLSMTTQEHFIHSTRDLTDTEQQSVAATRDILKSNRKDYQIMHVPKARNGFRTQIPVTNFYGHRFYQEKLS